MKAFLDSLTLSRFRSHHHASLRFDGRPVAVFGANGAGKTNLIEAISLLSPGRGLRGAAAADLAQRPDAIGWKITAEVTTGGDRHEIELRADDSGSRVCRIDGKAAPRTALGKVARILWLVPSMDRLWIEGAEGRRRFLDRMTMSFRPDHAEASLEYERAMRARNKLLKDHSGDLRWFVVLEARMAESGAKILANRADTLERLTRAQSDAATGFPAADLAIVASQGAEGAAGVSTPEELALILAEARPGDFRAGRSLAGPHRADMAAIYRDKATPAEHCSTGEQKALLISLLLANARALADELGSPPILLLDEVSAHLDADRRAALYDEILSLGCQAFLTGTGPELFTELGTKAQQISVSDAGGHSLIEELL